MSYYCENIKCIDCDDGGGSGSESIFNIRTRIYEYIIYYNNMLRVQELCTVVNDIFIYFKV